MLFITLTLLACSTEPAPAEDAVPPLAEASQDMPSGADGLPRNHIPPRPFHQPVDPDLVPVLAATKAKDGDTALSLLAPLLKKSPDSAEVNFFQGRALILKQSFAEAIPFLQQAAQTDPTLAQAHKELAGAYLSIREMAAAEASISTYLGMVDDDAEAYFMLGFCLKYRKDIDGAIAATQQACDLKMERACRVKAFLEDRKADAEAARQATAPEELTAE